MKHWISLSGGVGSGVSALTARRFGYDFELVFADTLIEDEDAYRFNRDIARACSKELITLTTGKDPWDIFVEKRYIGNTRTAHCSTELKTRPVMRFLDKFAGAGDALVLGMDWSEQDRIERAQGVWGDRPIVSLLNRHKITRPQHGAILALAGIKMPRLYEHGFPHNNCGGFCVKAGLKQFKTLMTSFPERFDQHEKRMSQVMEQIGPTARPFLRKTVNGDVNYLTLAQFKEAVEDGQIEIGEYDYRGCGCFSDE
ncbi:phosphoadenosine phosphosulfate reductase domain-containing protein [Sedimentitalea xiamensis]|nr:phosphoadenosine phosphosulfate reductase family protein [Sedimentitalea xiamensis]